MFTFYVQHEPTLCSPEQQMIHTRGKRPVFTVALFPLYKTGFGQVLYSPFDGAFGQTCPLGYSL